MVPNLHFKILPKSQKALWDWLTANSSPLNKYGFYLAGGTALALQLGHRHSMDFDFFSQQQDTSLSLYEWIKTQQNIIVRDQNNNTLNVEINHVKASFIGGYQYPQVEKSVDVGGISLASVLDIGLMKLLAITHRATVRDYIDLAAIVRGPISLSDLLEKTGTKYGKAFNQLIPLKALVSFDDVDVLDMPKMLDQDLQANWQKILKSSVKKIAS